MSIHDYTYAPSDRLLPDPDPRPAEYTIISVDDHLVEPPWLFEGRLPKKFQDDAPKIVETPEGHQQWHFDGKVFAQMGFNALVGRVDRDDFTFEPARFDDMRQGCFDINARVRDMDIVGIWASICFPSQITGFCGRIYSDASDPALGLAVTRAFNDWINDEWWGTYPERIVPMGITFLRDAHEAAAEIRRNAERGFVAVSLPEQPYMAGLPSIHDHEYWDPILRACVETDTIICLHIGSAGQLLPRDPAAPAGAGSGATLFQVQSLIACCEWLWAGVPLRYPSIKIAMSEGGIGWVPMVMDRLDFMMSQSGHGRTVWKQMAGDVLPSEILGRNFWFCTIDDPTTIEVRDRIGVDHIMLESDYPHADSTWPDTQDFARRTLGKLPPDEIAKITHLNAAALFRHPLPGTTR
ncbi:MAG: amidohydrolase family protein [Acidimicrobiales bacterium]